MRTSGNKMIIGIDLRCVPPTGEPGAGVAHAARAMALALLGLDRKHVWVVYMRADAEALDLQGANARIVKLSSASGAALREAMREAPCELLFVPSGAVSPGLSVPCVPWSHDIAIFDHPEWFPQNMFKRMLTTNLYRRGLLRAPVILTISDSTKQEIVAHFKLEPERIFVTHAGGDAILADLSGEALHQAKQRAKQRLAEHGVTQPFILCLGTLEPRKDIPTALEAWSIARRWFDHPTDIVIAGRDGWKLGPIAHAFDEARSFAGEGGSRIHRILSVSDDDRRDLLLAAEIVVIPSLHEGFSLVALEAMQAGTIVVASRVGALPEVIGDCGMLLPPGDVQAWARAMADLMNGDENRLHIAEQGKARSQGMTWKRAAEVALYALTNVVG